MIASLGKRRTGIYPGLEEALDKRCLHPVGTEIHRVFDGALLARYVERRPINGKS